MYPEIQFPVKFKLTSKNDPKRINYQPSKQKEIPKFLQAGFSVDVKYLFKWIQYISHFIHFNIDIKKIPSKIKIDFAT